jgi:RNA polymerase sigma-70 factor (ECF subfamily)
VRRLAETHFLDMTVPNGGPRLSDQQLVTLALQEDQPAFRELVRRYHQKVLPVVSRILGDGDTADSAVQETFIRAFRALVTYKPEYTFSGWLARIAKNVALNRVDKKKIETLAIEGSAYADTDEALRSIAFQVPAAGANPLEEVLSGEKDAELRRAIAGLKPQYREAVLLHVDGVRHDEIARRLGVSVNAVDLYISRGRKQLKKTLGERSDSNSG